MQNAIFLDGKGMGERVGEVGREMVKVASPVDGARVFPALLSAPGQSIGDVYSRRWCLAESGQRYGATKFRREMGKAVNIVPRITALRSSPLVEILGMEDDLQNNHNFCCASGRAWFSLYQAQLMLDARSQHPGLGSRLGTVNF